MMVAAYVLLLLPGITIWMSLLASSANVICPDGWHEYKRHCYYFHGDEKLNHTNAQAACRDLGAELVSVETTHEADFLVRVMLQTSGKNWWTSIFATDQDPDAWYWGNGCPLTYAALSPSYDVNAQELCARYRDIQIQGLDNRPCSSTYNYICERKDLGLKQQRNVSSVSRMTPEEEAAAGGRRVESEAWAQSEIDCQRLCVRASKEEICESFAYHAGDRLCRLLVEACDGQQHPQYSPGWQYYTFY